MPADLPDRSRAQWMHTPIVDLALIGYNWLPIYALYVALALTDSDFACDAHTQSSCPDLMRLMIIVTLFINRLHRHYSLGFAYGDREVFSRHRALYTWTPLVAFVLVIPCALYRAFEPGLLRTGLFSIYAFMVAFTGVWQVYHTIMQKYGFLRIYSAKLHYGDAKVEKNLFFSWLTLVITGSACKYASNAEDIIAYGPPEIRFLADYSDYLLPLSLTLLVPSVIYAGVFTWRWLGEERRNYCPASRPKLFFALSVALMMATFFHSLLIGVLLLGFSHAFEYCVFVNVYAVRKYRARPVRTGTSFLAFWAGYPITSNLALIALVYGLTVFVKLDWVRPWGALIAYSVFTSILHFLYDGLLWKVSSPEARSTLLRLKNA